MQFSVLVDLNELIGNHIPVLNTLFIQVRENSSHFGFLLIVKPPEYLEAISTVTNPLVIRANCKPVNLVISGEHEQEIPNIGGFRVRIESKQIPLLNPTRIVFLNK